MKIEGKNYTTIWLSDKGKAVSIIDQRYLPFKIKIEKLPSGEAVCRAIKDMHLRGAPLIGVAAAYGIYLALLKAPHHNLNKYFANFCAYLLGTRPTAVNLYYAVNKVTSLLAKKETLTEKIKTALEFAENLRQAEIESCKKIGEYGWPLLKKIYLKNPERPLNILTHCNAGWLACIDYGTATAPIYLAAENGIPVHVWVDETRPRNQGARLTAYELGQQGIAHTVITDNAGGYLMQKGLVDVIIVGSDRTTARGDVCNKIGTYLKALAAKACGLPFYVALPSSSIDLNIKNGIKEIPIENRSPEEVRYVEGLYKGKIIQSLSVPAQSSAINPSFDVTPAELVTALITEKGVIKPSEEEIKRLYQS